VSTEIIYQDSSTTTVSASGTMHEGPIAIERIRLLSLKSALKLSIKYPQLKFGGISIHAAIRNVLTPITNVTYKKSNNGKLLALDHVLCILFLIEDGAVVYTEES
jgi:hypothetical protein